MLILKSVRIRMTARKIGVMLFSKAGIQEYTFGAGCVVGWVAFVPVSLSGLTYGRGVDGGDRDVSPLRKCRMRMRRIE